MNEVRWVFCLIQENSDNRCFIFEEDLNIIIHLIKVYYDIHTHQAIEGQSFAIRSVHADFDKVRDGAIVSMGVHPWYLADVEQQLECLKKNLSRPEVLAVGECGLDKLSEMSWETQLLAFRKQIEIAGQFGKPLIIHCVKAFSEVLSELKGVAVPVIFHGINNRWSLIEPVLQNGYYLSFGKSLFSNQVAIQEVFVKTPVEKLFLETDDIEIDIKEVYKMAAQLKGIPEKDLVLQLENNFFKIFQR